MKILRTKKEMRAYIRQVKMSGKSVGFVPTMGSLHKGHISLFRNAGKENDVVTGSIFVNPTQFNDSSDYEHYPRDVQGDLEMLKDHTDAVFVPDENEIYPEKPGLSISFGELEKVMEGKHRPGHFNGVALVVSKLFNIIEPDTAYFGQKDLQQFRIIETMVKGLSFQTELKMCPIVREQNGLAMSSRNKRLSPEGLSNGSRLYEGLTLTAGTLKSTGNSSEAVKRGKAFYSEIPSLSLEYLEIVDAETLSPVGRVNGDKAVAVCVAARIDNVRLIDNIILFS